MTDPTPTPLDLSTEVIRDRHASYVTEAGGVGRRIQDRNAEFDAWLAAHDAALVAEVRRLRAVIKDALKIHPASFPTPLACTCSVCSTLRAGVTP